jgi:hypothetical protein
MTRSSIRNHLVPSLALVLGISLAHGALAADSTSGAEAQARSLLAPPPAPSATAHVVRVHLGDPSGDAQQLAGRLLAGRAGQISGTPPVKLAANGPQPAHGDPQRLAQRVMLGAGDPRIERHGAR